MGEWGGAWNQFKRALGQYYLGTEQIKLAESGMDAGFSAWRTLGRVGATFAAVDIASDLVSRGFGGLIYDEYGRFNISGVPFI